MAPHLLSYWLLPFMLSVVSGSQEELRLVKKLFVAYDTDVRPTDRPADVTRVQVSIRLYQIMNLDVRNQVLTCKLWIRQIWNDSFLWWNVSNYANISRISVNPGRLWQPGLVLYNSVSENSWLLDRYQAEVTSEGVVRWPAPTITHSSCVVDVRYFPWDQQTCTLEFGSWAYDTEAVDLDNHSEPLTGSDYVESGEWELLSTRVERQVAQYDCCDKPHAYLVVSVTIRRKPLYYVFNLLLPVILVKAVGLLVFYLPAPSREKVSLTVTILVSLTFFLRLVAQTLPVQSDTVPLLGEYIAAAIILISLSSAMTAYVLSCYHRGRFGHDVPRWAGYLAFHCLGRLLCMSRKVHPSFDTNKTGIVPEKPSDTYVPHQHQNEDPKNNREKTEINIVRRRSARFSDREEYVTANLEQIRVLLTSMEGHAHAQQVQARRGRDWVMLATVLDRLFLWLFTLSGLITACAILLQGP